MERIQRAEGTEKTAEEIDVVLADRDPLARGVIARSLADAGGFTVVGETASGQDAGDLCDRLRPAVAILEVKLREVDGVDAARRIAQVAPETRVVILTAAPVADFWLAALTAGTRGIVSKGTPIPEAVEAVRRVARGEHVIPPSVNSLLVERLRTSPTLRSRLRPVRSHLTEREWEVVALLREGATTAEVADRLRLSEETVYTHLKNMMRKLGVHRRSEILVAADALLRGTIIGF
jgi:two-component system nitrate/nitrite response regulator NarL